MTDAPSSGSTGIGGIATGEDAGSDVSTPSDVAAPDAVRPPPSDGTLAGSCGATDLGPTSEDTLTQMTFIREKAGCGGRGACAVVIILDVPCTLTIRRADGTPGVVTTMGPSDCKALKRWLTSDRLRSALSDPMLCSGVAEKGNPEINELLFTDGSRVGRKTANDCTDPPLPQHRACLQKVLDIYRPGETFY